MFCFQFDCETLQEASPVLKNLEFLRLELQGQTDGAITVTDLQDRLFPDQMLTRKLEASSIKTCHHSHWLLVVTAGGRTSFDC